MTCRFVVEGRVVQDQVAGAFQGERPEVVENRLILQNEIGAGEVFTGAVVFEDCSDDLGRIGIRR